MVLASRVGTAAGDVLFVVPCLLFLVCCSCSTGADLDLFPFPRGPPNPHPLLGEPGAAFLDTSGEPSFLQLALLLDVSSESEIITTRLRSTALAGRVAVLRSSTAPDSDLLALSLNGGYVTATVKLEAGSDSATLENRAVAAADGNWHTVTLRRDGAQLELAVDGRAVALQLGGADLTLDLAAAASPVLVMGDDVASQRSSDTAFVGLLHGLRVRGRAVLVDALAGVAGSDAR